MPAERLLAGGDDGVVAPAEGMPDGVAGRELLGPRLDHLADRHDPVHRRLEREGDEVPLRALLAEAHPQARVDGRPRVADEHLSAPRRRHRALDDREVVRPHLALRVADELDLASRDGAHRSRASTSRPIRSVFSSSRSTPTARVPM